MVTIYKYRNFSSGSTAQRSLAPRSYNCKEHGQAHPGCCHEGPCGGAWHRPCRVPCLPYHVQTLLRGVQEETMRGCTGCDSEALVCYLSKLGNKLLAKPIWLELLFVVHKLVNAGLLLADSL